ncbi:MAG: exo-alpha-sialidase [Verrucomicrobiota bacterium]|nr:exo-alpha-sialidase [Limisphaera sp.]MDW8382111.1 exo-alpha-sialidase [Verrucomicrobiota bacterium]
MSSTQNKRHGEWDLRPSCLRLIGGAEGGVVLFLALAWELPFIAPASPAEARKSVTIDVVAAGFEPGAIVESGPDKERVTLRLVTAPNPWPFNQAAVQCDTNTAHLGPRPDLPYFHVRWALPIPPDNDTNLTGWVAGLAPEVWAHNHSPGFEVLPNGDVLAVYFSARTASGLAESASDTRFIQARLRYGTEEWEMPELFLDFEGFNDQSALLWRDGHTTWFFGGGRGISEWVPFKYAISTNHGMTWTLALPRLFEPARDYTAQPIANAFRTLAGRICFAMDAAADESFLWCSEDHGRSWVDLGGRIPGRHATVVPLRNDLHFLAFGGKNVSINGWAPQSESKDGGRSWSQPQPSPFPALSSNQRLCMIRLANGHLCMVTDSVQRRSGQSPSGWAHGTGPVVALSTNDGRTWHFKALPVALPHERDRRAGTLGYATVRQAPNGLIHVLSTMTHPCLHYEFNEAWVFSEAGDMVPESDGGHVQQYQETYPDGSLRLKWSARICPNGRYLLHGPRVAYYPDGRQAHEVIYENGRKIGRERYWAPDGTLLWEWHHKPQENRSVWIHYWPNGKVRLESTWHTRPLARDITRRFYGRLADGPVRHWDDQGRLYYEGRFVEGQLISALPGQP